VSRNFKRYSIASNVNLGLFLKFTLKLLDL
jgi:hypothetical protein